MNRIKCIKNAHDFKELFGERHGTRRNKILLEHLKSKALWDWCRMNGDYTLIEVIDLSSLIKNLRIYLGCNSYDYFERGQRNWKAFDYWGVEMWSSNYRLDDLDGIPEDGSIGFIRYVRVENNDNGDGHVYKMKAGKYFSAILEYNSLWRVLAPQVKTYFLEELVSQWNAHLIDKCGSDYELHVDDRFDKIYNNGYCRGDFHSCMGSEGFHSFYEEAVEAQAAYLTNEMGDIVARCVIFTNVKDQDDPSAKPLRLAERQYSTECDDDLKRALVNKLIAGNYIDGYKRVGADCHDTKNFVLIDGTSLRKKHLYIDCVIDGCKVSYQDSFKFYNESRGVAYNTECSDYDYDLSVTDGELEERYWDEYNERYCSEIRQVYWQGRAIDTDCDDLSDFVWVIEFDEYIHRDEIVRCPNCDCNMPDPELYSDTFDMHHSDITDEYYCCNDCRLKAEREYKEENWISSDYSGNFYENDDEAVRFFVWDGDDYDGDHWVGNDEVDYLVGRGWLILYGEDYYRHDSVNEDGIPFDVAEEMREIESAEKK